MNDNNQSTLLTSSPLAGRVALVTGAAAGMGRAVSRRLASAGAAVALVDRDTEGLEQTRALIHEAGGQAECHTADLEHRDEVVGCVDFAVARFGTVHILVNCAGIAGPTGALLESDEASWNAVFAVNVTAPYLLMKRVGKLMADGGDGGNIVSITSSSAHRARMSLPAYGASKSALMQLTRSAAADLAVYGINVNAVAPGLTATRLMSDSFPPEALEQALHEGPLSNLFARVSQPEDIADTVLFLCLPASRQITGQTIHVSAGAVI